MNYGMRVLIKYNDKHSSKVKIETLNNVTEIHYNFDSLFKMQIAFESDIHKDGCIRKVNEIEEFEAIMQTTKEAEF